MSGEHHRFASRDMRGIARAAALFRHSPLRAFAVSEVCGARRMLAAFCASVSDAAGRVLHPQGPIAAIQRTHLIEVVAVLMVVVPPVILTAWHFRYTNRSATYRPRWSFS
jgi:hypothetical protein